MRLMRARYPSVSHPPPSHPPPSGLNRPPTTASNVGTTTTPTTRAPGVWTDALGNAIERTPAKIDSSRSDPQVAAARFAPYLRRLPRLPTIGRRCSETSHDRSHHKKCIVGVSPCGCRPIRRSQHPDYENLATGMTTAMSLQENRFEVRGRSPRRSLPVDDRECRRAAAARIRPVV